MAKKKKLHKTMHTKSGMIDKRKAKSSIGGGNCFISTVCFGESSIETHIFRNWRDNYLINKYWGKKFVSWYYDNGEMLSNRCKQFKILKVCVSYLLCNLAQVLKKRYGGFRDE